MTRISRIETSHAEIEIAESAGDGPAVLMIHGNSSCKEVFRNQYAGEIGARYHCIAMDLPGHGASSDAKDPDRTYWMPGYADCAHELMNSLGHENYAVLGWSLGGHIGIEMLVRSPGVERLMITGSPPFARTSESISAGFRTNDHMHLAAQRDLSKEEVLAYAKATCGVNAPYDPLLERAVARTDGRARELMFGRILDPATQDNRQVVTTNGTLLAVVNGEEDQFINNDFIAAIPYANLWENTVHRLERIGHAPFWEAPEIFNPVFVRFMETRAPL